MKSTSMLRPYHGQKSFRTPLILPALLAFVGLSGQSPAVASTADISPYSIEIDANLFPSGATNLVDWVKDSLTNTDTASLSNSIALGIIPNVTGAPGGKGHWYGVRIVDGVDGNEQDIFLNGGKENDTSTWTIGPGSVGSAKYDITQAYLANNQTTLFFGMERRGNNGTTAFDFEFNQAAPNSATPYIPKRTVGDALFTFELNGSGSSGSATPHYFMWNGSAYIEQNPLSSMVSVINNADIPAAPWGFVDSKGNWVLGRIPRFEFAEASVNLHEAFPNFKPCNNRVFVQVRTRSSATDTSDLKDTTKIFPYEFGGPHATVALSTTCLGQLVFNGSGSADSNGGTNVTYLWNVTPPSGVTLSGTGITGPDSHGVYHSTLLSGTADVAFPTNADSAILTVSLTVIEDVNCTNNSGNINFTVEAPLRVDITEKGMTGSNLTVSLTGTAKPAAGTTYKWQRLAGTNAPVNITGATSSVLSYSSFESDVAPSIVNATILGDPYQAQLFQVTIRVHAERTVNGVVCTANSAPITIRKVIAVDP